MQRVAGGGEGIGLFLTIRADWEHRTRYQGVNPLLTRPSSKLEKQFYRMQLG